MSHLNKTPATPGQDRPYAPSWVDHVIHRLDDLAMPTWFWLLVIYLAIAIYFQAIFWADGLLPLGNFNPEITLNAIWFPLVLGIIVYLDRVAAQSWRTFVPALSGDTADLMDFEYRITTMPRWPTAAATLLGPVIAAITARTQAENYLLFTPELSRGGAALIFVVVSISFAMLPILAYHTVRQLRLVSLAYSQVAEIDLYDVRSMFAFSRLSSRTGIVMILAMNINLANTQIRSASAAGPTLTGTDILVIGTEIGIAVLAFILPLWGIHRKLADAKDAALTEVMARLKRVYEQVNREVRQGNLATEIELERTERLLSRQKQILEATSTWPWDPGTLRGFASAMLLPLLLWLLQQLMARTLLGP